tara:strand:+ start:11099 stop:11971 length:873 start_codon:yes stop_codon:yes gene_type:complete
VKTTTNRITRLGLTAALAGTTLLTACGGEGEGEGEGEGNIASINDTYTGEGEGEGEGEGAAESTVVPSGGGEGEGGVEIEKAATDPVVFRAALAITEAHIVAARDAYAVGEKQAAAEMFAHPVSEVLLDVGPYLRAQGVEEFDAMLTAAADAVFDGETEEQINARTEDIIATLREAAKKAPDDGSSEARIQAGVAADQIDRAAVMYGISGESDAYEPYLDGYGFMIAAEAAYEQEKAAINSELPEAAASIEAALELMKSAYPTVERPETLDKNPAALTAASSAILLALGG